MLYFEKNGNIIGKVKRMPAHQYADYLKDGFVRCEKDGKAFDEKDAEAEKKRYAARAKKEAEKKAQTEKEAKKQAAIDKAIKDKLVPKNK